VEEGGFLWLLRRADPLMVIGAWAVTVIQKAPAAEATRAPLCLVTAYADGASSAESIDSL
jgi:hypothetical protein